MIGTDSHTPNAGGLGMVAIGVGGADAVDVMAGLPLEISEFPKLKAKQKANYCKETPKIIGVNLTGSLSGWASPKGEGKMSSCHKTNSFCIDVILRVVGELSVKGATGSIIEYFGSGIHSLSCTGMATICNMGAETGASASIFPYTDSMGVYLDATGRSYMRKASQAWAHELAPDPGAEYDQLINIDLSNLEPFINGPLTPDLATPNSQFKELVARSRWPRELSAGLIGSCTNSSFEDMSRAASLVKQALAAGLKPRIPLLLSPGSEKTRVTLQQAGVLDIFNRCGATILANACGPCCGSWNRTGMEKGTKNSVVSSYNRNFNGRLDSNPETSIFLTSPEMVIAKAFSGDLDFDPINDSIATPDKDKFQFQPPESEGLPRNGYEDTDYMYTAPPIDRSDIKVKINPSSNRIQKLDPFDQWDGDDFIDMAILIKVKGKCTTDHITPAGKWFAWRS